MSAAVRRVALIGLGEVGRVLAEDLGPQVEQVTAWDVAFTDPASRPSRTAAQLGVRVADGPLDAVRGADLVISAVTAAHDVTAALDVAAGLRPGAWYLDLNSASPQAKREAADVVEAAGGRYVEAAVMSPIHPRRTASPMLLGGPHTTAFRAVADPLGFTALRDYAADVGLAAATKLCRSVVVKGLEALVTESLLAARAYGVEHEVLGSLGTLFSGGGSTDGEQLAGYLVSRSAEHGVRRAEEMREAARTVAAVGVTPLMAAATADRQDLAGRAAHLLTGAAHAPKLLDLLDALRHLHRQDPA